MARARNIKPGFFTNDVLGELPALGRLLFAGLWTLCDRAGRLEDRPKKIKAEVLPYDECDADQLLEQLHEAGFIVRYEAAEKRFIQVHNWDKHQNPHVKEAASTIPAPCLSGASTMLAQGEAMPKPAPAGLIPDSLSLDSRESVALADGSASARASRLPKNWVLPDEWRAYCAQERPDLDPNTVAENFRDHWIAKPGKDGTKLDWFATWRSWVRKEHAARSGASGQGVQRSALHTDEQFRPPA